MLAGVGNCRACLVDGKAPEHWLHCDAAAKRGIVLIMRRWRLGPMQCEGPELERLYSESQNQQVYSRTSETGCHRYPVTVQYAISV